MNTYIKTTIVLETGSNQYINNMEQRYKTINKVEYNNKLVRLIKTIKEGTRLMGVIEIINPKYIQMLNNLYQQ